MRGLDDAQAHAVERFDHLARGVDGLDGVGHRNCGHRRRSAGDGGDGPRDEGRGRERPGRVMNEDDFRGVRRERFEAGADRGLTRRPAVDGAQKLEPLRGLGKQGTIIRMDHGLYDPYARMQRKQT